MDHDIGSIENVVPRRDVLDVDEINHAAIQQPIHNVAATTTGNESEADIFVGLYFFTAKQVNN